MSDPEDGAENFLKRWLRRKQAAEARSRAARGAPESADAEAKLSPDIVAPSAPDPPVVDAATLPPVESITAASDIRAFLMPGVPEGLSRAALRRAWVTDPTIRDFIGLAENQLDFTKSDAVPGFGSLESTPELRRLVDRLFGEPTEPHAGGESDKPIAASAQLAPRAAPPAAADDVVPGPPQPRPALPPNTDAAQEEHSDTDEPPALPHPRHGGALPK
jgi:hypothetical protein